MKIITTSFFVIFFISAYSQNNLFEGLPCKIGDKISNRLDIETTFEDGSFLTKRIKVKSQYFKRIQLIVSKENKVLKIRGFYKNNDKVLSYLKSNAVFSSDYKIRRYKIDLTTYSSEDYEYTLDHRDDILFIESMNHYPFDKKEDKFKKKIHFYSNRSQVYQKESYSNPIYLKFFFSKDSNLIFCEINLEFTKWLLSNEISVLLDNKKVYDFSLVKKKRDVSYISNSVEEDYIFALTKEEAKEISLSKSGTVRVTGEESFIEFPFINSWRFALKDILRSNDFKRE